jgi:uncharacterized protein YjbJ (UPF0337 family)
MISPQTLEGNWNEIKGRIRQHWGKLTDNDLPQAQGNIDELVGIIQRRTGEAREAVEDYLESLSDRFGPSVASGTEAVRNYARQAAETVQQKARQVGDQVRGSYIEAERFVRDRPTQSMVACFGLGVVTGLVIGLVLRAR